MLSWNKWRTRAPSTFAPLQCQASLRCSACTMSLCRYRRLARPCGFHADPERMVPEDMALTMINAGVPGLGPCAINQVGRYCDAGPFARIVAGHGSRGPQYESVKGGDQKSGPPKATTASDQGRRVSVTGKGGDRGIEGAGVGARPGFWRHIKASGPHSLASPCGQPRGRRRALCVQM